MMKCPYDLRGWVIMNEDEGDWDEDDEDESDE